MRPTPLLIYRTGSVKCLLSVIATTMSLVASGCGGQSRDGAERELGAIAHVGAATASSYAEFDESGTPLAIGLVFSQNFFDELPSEPSDLHQCFDRDGNRSVERPAECNAWHEWVIPLPSEVAIRRTYRSSGRSSTGTRSVISRPVFMMSPTSTFISTSNRSRTYSR